MTLSSFRPRDRERCRRLMVLLDGKPCPNAFYADGRRGVVREFVAGADGRPQLERDGAGAIVGVRKRERRGKVTWRTYRTDQICSAAYRLAILAQGLR